MNDMSIKLFFSAFGDPNRFKILTILESGPKNISEISEKSGIEQSNVSHHMECLLNCGFVKMERRGREHIYSLDPNVKKLVKGIKKHINAYESHLRACGIISEKEGAVNATR